MASVLEKQPSQELFEHLYGVQANHCPLNLLHLQQGVKNQREPGKLATALSHLM